MAERVIEATLFNKTTMHLVKRLPIELRALIEFRIIVSIELKGSNINIRSGVLVWLNLGRKCGSSVDWWSKIVEIAFDELTV